MNVLLVYFYNKFTVAQTRPVNYPLNWILNNLVDVMSIQGGGELFYNLVNQDGILKNFEIQLNMFRRIRDNEY